MQLLETKRKRDPDFRNRILREYEFSWLMQLNVRLGHKLVTIDATHIQFHQAGGPDIEENGISLCSHPHKLFDRKVFAITRYRQLLVAEEAHGKQGFEEWLMRFHGKKICSPISPDYKPKEIYIE